MHCRCSYLHLSSCLYTKVQLVDSEASNTGDSKSVSQVEVEPWFDCDDCDKHILNLFGICQGRDRYHKTDKLRNWHHTYISIITSNKPPRIYVSNRKLKE